MKNYGKELILDLHDCNPDKFTRKALKKFFKMLCKEIDMDREKLVWWDYAGDNEGYLIAPPHLKGVSAVQFISTSNITIHTLDDLKQAYINIFSCKDFNAMKAANFCKKYFKGNILNRSIIHRG